MVPPPCSAAPQTLAPAVKAPGFLGQVAGNQECSRLVRPRECSPAQGGGRKNRRDPEIAGLPKDDQRVLGPKGAAMSRCDLTLRLMFVFGAVLLVGSACVREEHKAGPEDVRIVNEEPLPVSFPPAAPFSVRQSSVGCSASCDGGVGKRFSCSAQGANATCSSTTGTPPTATCSDGTNTTSCVCGGPSPGCTTA